jgi:iron uptake system component EfeO
MHRLVLLAPCVALSLACGSGALTDAQQQTAAVQRVHDSLATEIEALRVAAVDLQAAAPVPAGRGWDAVQDASAIAAMKVAWQRARTAYEHTEGALAPIFPDTDAAIDERYDGFLEALNGQADPDLFDGAGVTGMHAIERILYSDVTPAEVIAREQTLPGYTAAAFPSTEAEAQRFKAQLCGQLIADVTSLQAQWQPAKIDLPGAYQGLIDLMKEQHEKVNNAGSQVEESRYSQRTMKDLRDNLAGTRAVYEVFKPWLLEKSAGPDLDAKVTAGFLALEQVYATVSGDAIPPAPGSWKTEAETHSADELATPFGRLYTAITSATDARTSGSIVAEMNEAGQLLGFPGDQ